MTRRVGMENGKAHGAEDAGPGKQETVKKAVQFILSRKNIDNECGQSQLQLENDTDVTSFYREIGRELIKQIVGNYSNNNNAEVL